MNYPPRSVTYHANCLDVLRLLADNSIDACITDPPYGIDFQSCRRSRNEWLPKIQNDAKPYTSWLTPLYSKMRDGGRLICFYRWDVQDEFLKAIAQAGFTVKSQLVWDKMHHGMGDLKGEFAPQHELMLYATKGRYEFVGKRPKTVYRLQRVDADALIHPNEKPVSLLRAIIRDITSPGEEIFEPFAGSFATYKAAQLEGRECLATEMDDHYFKIGNASIAAAIQQSQLFL